MDTKHLSSAALAILLVAAGASPDTRADGDCVARPATAAERSAFTSAYELFLRVAPEAPEGWTAIDTPPTSQMPTLCQGSEGEPIRRGFQRRFERNSDQQARDAQAQQAYADMAQRQQARAAANQAQIDVIDARLKTLTKKVQEAASAQRFGEIETLNQEMSALMEQRMALAGYDQLDTETERIEAEHSRDTDARFTLWFEVPRNEPRSGQPYRTSAGQALLSAYDDKGNPRHDVHVYFAGAPQQARLQVVGAPERVRALLDTADLKAIAAFR